MHGAQDHGEVRCLLCGRYLADATIGEDGRVTLLPAPRGEDPTRTVRLRGGALHCTKCGGRAFIEQDLLPIGQSGLHAA
ncbi:MAG: hypothetical protein C4290_09585 [Chloroflexota bacterium]